jgi:hypothetical protein
MVRIDVFDGSRCRILEAGLRAGRDRDERNSNDDGNAVVIQLCLLILRTARLELYRIRRVAAAHSRYQHEEVMALGRVEKSAGPYTILHYGIEAGILEP